MENDERKKGKCFGKNWASEQVKTVTKFKTYEMNVISKQ